MERSLRTALLGEAPPEELRLYGLRNTDDPWTELAGLRLSEDSVRSLARLLLVERLMAAVMHARSRRSSSALRTGTRQSR